MSELEHTRDLLRLAERDATKLRAERNSATAVLTRIATHENLDDCLAGGVFALSREDVEWVRTGLVEAGYLEPRVGPREE